MQGSLHEKYSPGRARDQEPLPICWQFSPCADAVRRSVSIGPNSVWRLVSTGPSAHCAATRLRTLRAPGCRGGPSAKPETHPLTQVGWTPNRESIIEGTTIRVVTAVGRDGNE